MLAAAAAAHCLSLTCGKLIATSIMLLNEFVYPAQFTKNDGGDVAATQFSTNHPVSG